MPLVTAAKPGTPLALPETDAARGVDVLAEVRRRAVAAAESGVSQADVARVFGVSRQTVARWLRIYRQGGDEMLRSGRRGRRPGEQLALAPAQQCWVRHAIVGWTPEQFGLYYRLWTRQALAELINRELGIQLSVTSIRNYLIRWGFLGDGKLLATLRSEHAMLATSRQTVEWLPGAETLWADWTRPASSDGAAIRLDGPAEVPQDDPAVLRAVSNRGVMYFVARTDPFGWSQISDFLVRLREQLHRKVNVVLNWEPRYNTESMPDWLASNAGDVAIRFSRS